MSTDKDMFLRNFDAQHGSPIPVGSNIARVTCTNSGPLTFAGTNSYIVGTQTLGIIDPGPINDEHYDALIAAINGRDVSHIFITHTHVDHSPLARRLKEATGAKIVGAAPHFAARALHLGEINALDASADHDHQPDEILRDGNTIDSADWSISAIETPGHTANHLSFALGETGTVFTGDHIMAWATSIVAPPDGSMTDYMASLTKMLERDDTLYLPGHGGEVKNPRAFVRGLKGHRKMRERAILERVKLGDLKIEKMVKEIYRDTDPRLHGAAGLSVFAHLEDLIGQGRVTCEGEPSLTKSYYVVG